MGRWLLSFFLSVGLAGSLSGAERVYNGRPLRAWAARFVSEESHERREAASVLSRIGKRGVPVLSRFLKHPQSGIRSLAAQTLFEMPGDIRSAEPQLRAALKDENRHVRAWAARALERFTYLSPANLPVWSVALQDKDERVRAVAATVLGKVGGKKRAEKCRQAVALLMEALADRKKEVRVRAAEALGYYGLYAEAAAPRLAGFLNGKDKELCKQALLALTRVHAVSKTMLPKLRQFLEDRNLRSASLQALETLGPRAAPAVPDILRLFDERDFPFKDQIFRTLKAIGPAAKASVPKLKEYVNHPPRLADVYGALRAMGPDALEAASALVAKLQNLGPKRQDRFRIIETLAAMGPDVLPHLKPLRQSGNAHDRQSGIQILKEIKPETGEVLAALQLFLLDPEADVRSRAAEAIGSRRHLSRKIVLELLEAIRREDKRKEHGLAYRLGPSFGKAEGEAIPVLIDALKDADRYVRLAASKGLAAMGGRAVPALENRLKDSDAKVRRRAVDVLASMDASVAGVAPTLGRMLGGDEPDLRWPAIEGLVKHGARAAPILARALKSPKQDVRRQALYGLRSLGDHAQAAAPQLAEHLKEEKDERLLASNMRVLRKLGEKGRLAEPELIHFAHGDNAMLRHESLRTLLAIGPSANLTLPVTLKSLQHGDPETRTLCMRILQTMGPKAKPAVPVLVEVLREKCDLKKILGNRPDRQERLRLLALRTLASMGSAAKDAVPEVARRLNSPSGREVIAAAYTLAAIGSGAQKAARALRKGRNHPDAIIRWAQQRALARIQARPLPKPPAELSDWRRIRREAGRMVTAQRFGVSLEALFAIDDALRWLARHQEPDGRWHDVKYGGKKADISVTGLSLLAFLGAGHSETAGIHRANVRRTIAWLKSVQREDGCFGKQDERLGLGYQHAIAAYAMAEAAGMSLQADTVRSAQRAVRYSIEIHQSERNGAKWGWRYEPGSSMADISVSAWFIMQLAAARRSALRVDPESLKGACRFLDSVQDVRDKKLPRHRYGYREADAANAGRTAIGCWARMLLGAKPSGLRQSVEWFIAEGGRPTWDDNGSQVNLYHWYFGSACALRIGGGTWTRWNASLEKALLENQRGRRDEAGSWDPVGSYSSYWGRVGQTALACLCLETPFR